MHTRILPLATAVVFCLGSSLGLPTLAADASKAIHVRAPAAEAPPRQLRVEFKPLQDGYRVGEPIRFRVRGNQRFFLYVYNISADGGKATLLLPNRRQQGNKYQAGKDYRIPNANVEFFADRAGNERVVMVASSRYIDVKKLPLTKEGDFFSIAAQQLEQGFAAKGIHIRAPQVSATQPAASDVVVADLRLKIAPAPAAAEPSAAVAAPAAVTTAAAVAAPVAAAVVAPTQATTPGSAAATSVGIPFLSTDRNQYYAGDEVAIVYGADQAGWMTIYTTEPGGATSRLLQRRVDSGQVYKAHARAVPPSGDHTLIAVLSSDQPGAAEGAVGKGLILEADDAPANPRVVHSFRILPR